MSPIPEEDIHNIVERVVLRTIGSMNAPVQPEVQKSAPPAPALVNTSRETPPTKKIVAIGADHGGF